jgi:predicted short-subunit dehydrogenase-like oxidoreductase (DUF2520 family)
VAEIEPVFVVGAGRVGSALGGLLAGAGLEVLGLWSRSSRTAEAAGALTGLPCAFDALSPDIGMARTVVIAVHDEAVPAVAGALLDGGLLRSAETVLHCGGALPAREALSPLVGQEQFSLGTLHPLVAVADPARALRHLPGAHFAVEGDEEARETGRMLARSIGARTFELEAGEMTLYHAAAVLASNHPVAIWHAARQLLEQAGVAAAGDALSGLLRSTLENVEQLGLPGALTGPVRRGDASTVIRHMEELGRRAPRLLPLYQACTAAAAQTAEHAEPGLKEALERIRGLVKPQVKST